MTATEVYPEVFVLARMELALECMAAGYARS